MSSRKDQIKILDCGCNPTQFLRYEDQDPKPGSIQQPSQRKRQQQQYKTNGADKIFSAQTIITLNPEQPFATHIAVRDNAIVAVGDAKTVAPWQGSNTEVIDFGAKTITPGFIESHAHPLIYGILLGHFDVSIDAAPTREAVLAKIRKAHQELPKDKLLLAWGYDPAVLSDKNPITRAELDAISTERSIIVVHISLHIVFVNQVIFNLANITDSTADPKGGHFVRDDQGQLTGEIQELPALERIIASIPPIKYSNLLEAGMRAGQYFQRQGCTTVCDAGVGLATPNDDFLIYQDLIVKPEFPVRIIGFPIWTTYGNLPLRNGFGNNYFKIGPMKIIIDGSIQGYTANLLSPYYDQPENSGAPTLPLEKLKQDLLHAHKMGFQVAIHANGDAAVEQAIDAIEYALEQCPRDNHRHRIEHCQVVSDQQLARMAKLGILANFFVSHTYYWGDFHREHTLGPERAAKISPLVQATQHGVKFTLHSDAPVTPPNPLFCAWSAVNRQTRSGQVLGADQCIDVLSALKSITLDAAYFCFEEHLKGSIEVAKLADFTILDQNPLQVDPLRLKDIPIHGTVVGGQVFVGK